MSMTPRHGSVWKVLLILTGILAASVASGVLWVQSVAARKWTVMESQVAQLLQQATAHPDPRPVLRGIPVPGNAWEDYSRALDRMRSSESDRQALQSWFLDRGTEREKDWKSILSGDVRVLEDLRRGVQRSEGRLRRDWEREDPGQADPEYKTFRALFSIGILEARREKAGGRPLEACRLLLDLCQVAHDVSDHGTLFSLVLAAYLSRSALEELQSLLLSDSLKEPGLGDVARELEILDLESPDPAPTFKNELLQEGILLKNLRARDLLEDRYVPGGSGGGWRFGFSRKLMAGAAWEDLRRHYLLECDALQGPWAGLQQVARRNHLEARLSKNELVRILFVSHLHVLEAHRTCVAHLRLLRMGLQYRRTGDVQELNDPFGTRLFSRKEGRRLRVWSVGEDGVDHGGIGGWNPERGKDIVLEVER
jgi:hypothetical protein